MPALYPKSKTMSDTFAKLIEAAALLGLAVERTPGRRIKLTDAEGNVVATVASTTQAADVLQARAQEVRAAQAPAAAAPAAPTEERKAKAPRKARTTAPLAGQPVPADVVAAFKALPNGAERAAVLRDVVQTYGRQAAIEQLGVSGTRVYSQLNTLALVEQSQVIRDYLEAKRLSWTQVLMKISFNARKGLEYQEQLAHQLAA